ncbi:MAG: hypothetical protein ACKPA7_32465 [Sphaerospermopsis kisseleviana]
MMMSTKRERSLFRNNLGERLFKIRVVVGDRCFGMWECDCLKLGLCAIAKRCCKQFAVWEFGDAIALFLY